ncbi:MAG: hypothetical protein AB7L66_21470 [Gemmatimonadales bacterium]
MPADILVVSNVAAPAVAAYAPTLSVLLKFAAGDGLRVAFQTGIAAEPSAPVVANHVDLTETPPAYRDYFRRFPRGVNTALVDIGKATVCHDRLVRPDGDYRGPVIVKTNLNYGGMPERASIRGTATGLGRWFRLRRHAHRSIDPHEYPIYQRVEDVPPAVWNNVDLVVQPFRTERTDEGYYCLRFWYVFGSRGFHSRIATDTPIVKGSNILDRRLIEEPTPPGLLAARERLGVDYGRFDYVISDGEAILFDVNRTPNVQFQTVAIFEQQYRDLAKGVYEFLP